MITQSHCHELFEYKDGNLYWKPVIKSKNRPSVRNGRVVGTVVGNGYLNVNINKQRYPVHRLIFLMFHNYLPEEVDHINNNKQDNHIENLRAANTQTNKYNTLLSRHNTSGIKGVSWHKTIKKWRCSLSFNNRIKQVYGFTSKEDAADFMDLWRKEAHGEFANNGIRSA